MHIPLDSSGSYPCVFAFLSFLTQVDAVYIATPPSSHKEMALLCAEMGKPCLVEKPMYVCKYVCKQRRGFEERRDRD